MREGKRCVSVEGPLGLRSPAYRVVIDVQGTGLYKACAGDTSAEGVHEMIAVKHKGTVTKDHRLELTIPPSVPSGEMDVIILHSEPSPGTRVRGHKQAAMFHPAAGMWADREEIGDTITFVSQLRQCMETRHDAPQ